MVDIKSMTLEELTAWLQGQGEPAFRAKQIFQWLYRGVTSFEEMTNLSKALRQRLGETALLAPPVLQALRALPVLRAPLVLPVPPAL